MSIKSMVTKDVQGKCGKQENAELLLNEAKSIFPNTILAEDGLKVDINRN